MNRNITRKAETETAKGQMIAWFETDENTKIWTAPKKGWKGWLSEHTLSTWQLTVNTVGKQFNTQKHWFMSEWFEHKPVLPISYNSSTMSYRDIADVLIRGRLQLECRLAASRKPTTPALTPGGHPRSQGSRDNPRIHYTPPPLILRVRHVMRQNYLNNNIKHDIYGIIHTKHWRRENKNITHQMQHW